MQNETTEEMTIFGVGWAKALEVEEPEDPEEAEEAEWVRARAARERFLARTRGVRTEPAPLDPRFAKWGVV